MQHVGQFADGAATATLTIVSGTDELRETRGGGDFRADPAGTVVLDLGPS